MASPVYDAPTLSYVGSVDLSVTYGSSMYNIFFDPDIIGNGTVLMFEYKIQPANVTDPSPNSITLGYIDTENTIYNTGIANQWQISVPAKSDEYNPNPAQTIQVRVIFGVNGSSLIQTTPWSNSLDVHNPPPQPKVPLALFTTPVVGDPSNLYVLVKTEDNIDYEEVRFLVAYYYQNDEDATTWDISELLTAGRDVEYKGDDCKLLTIPNFGTVINSEDPVVYTSVYCVYPFEHGEDPVVNYYSVSHISVTYDAHSSNKGNYPTIYNINYLVYSVPSEQKMIIQWYPPDESILVINTIQNYVLEYSTNGTTWINISSSIGPLVTSWEFNVSGFGCNTTLSYRVKALYVNGGQSEWSTPESKNIYKYSSAPVNLSILDTSVSNDKVSINIKFFNPSSTGCGTPGDFVITVNNDPATEILVHYVANPQPDGYYTQTINNISQLTGSVQVYLKTKDTNSEDYLNGATASVPYAAGVIVLEQPTYEIYNQVNPTQSFDLNWSITDVDPWTITSYTLYMKIGSGDFVIVQTGIDGTALSYNYALSDEEQQCGNSFTFQIEANLSNDSNSFSIMSNATPDPINFYSYSTAPTNLVIKNTGSNDGTYYMTVEFNNPLNAGCYKNLYKPNFTIEVNDVVEANIEYVSNIDHYSINLTGLPDSAGTVTVYLNTASTNYPFDYLAGAPASSPYIVNTVTLYTPVYNIYNQAKPEQSFNLSWSMPVPQDGWSLDGYNLQVSLKRGDFSSIYTGLGTSYVYNIPEDDTKDCSNYFQFCVLATLSKDSTTYVIESNTSDPIDLFTYASDPVVTVNWAVSNDTNTKMDINMMFYQAKPGCGDPTQYTVIVKNEAGGIIGETTVPYNKSYDPNLIPPPSYTVNFADLEYSPSGVIQVYLETIDPNYGNKYKGATGTTYYFSGQIPIYKNLSINPEKTIASFNIVSKTPFAPIAGIAIPVSGTLYYTQFNTNEPVQTVILNNNVTAKMTIISSRGDNGEYIRNVSIDSSPSLLPAVMGIVSANAAGIGELPIIIPA